MNECRHSMFDELYLYRNLENFMQFLIYRWTSIKVKYVHCWVIMVLEKQLQHLFLLVSFSE
jgi:hypothetical protein